MATARTKSTPATLKDGRRPEGLNKTAPFGTIGSNKAANGSRRHRHHMEAINYTALYPRLRDPGMSPTHTKKLGVSVAGYELERNYRLDSVDFGNWVTEQDRQDYVCALMMALFDMRHALNLPPNLGAGTLAVSFGGRGKGKALATYSTSLTVINITRYKRGDKSPGSRDLRFLGTGGMGSFAHEYGHFMDNIMGRACNVPFLSMAQGPGIPQIMADVLNSPQMKAVRARISRMDMIPESFEIYLTKPVELWARAFEVYLKHKLEKQGVSNYFLTHATVYDQPFYLTRSEVAALAPQIDKIITVWREVLKALKS